MFTGRYQLWSPFKRQHKSRRKKNRENLLKTRNKKNVSEEANKSWWSIKPSTQRFTKLELFCSLLHLLHPFKERDQHVQCEYWNRCDFFFSLFTPNLFKQSQVNSEKCWKYSQFQLFELRCLQQVGWWRRATKFLEKPSHFDTVFVCQKCCYFLFCILMSQSAMLINSWRF